MLLQQHHRVDGGLRTGWKALLRSDVLQHGVHREPDCEPDDQPDGQPDDQSNLRGTDKRTDGLCGRGA